MEMIPHTKIVQAHTNYHKHNENYHINFWTYVGKRGRYRVDADTWEVTAEAARKIDMLLSPYAEVLLKAHSIRQGE